MLLPFQPLLGPVSGKTCYGALPRETFPLLSTPGCAGVNDLPSSTTSQTPDHLPAPSRADRVLPLPSCPCLGQTCRHWGLLLALLVALSSSLVSVLVQQLSSVDPACLSTFRFISVMPVAGLAALRHGEDVFPRGHRTNLLLRAVLGAAALMCKFYALRRMPLADASVVLLSAPVFVSVWACLLLGESCGVLHVLALLSTVSGALLIVRPGWLWHSDIGEGGTVPLVGAALAVSSALLLSAAYIALRRLQTVHWSSTVLVFGAVGSLMSYSLWLGTGARGSPSGAAQWLLVAAMGGLTVLMQLAFTVACQLEQAGPVAVMRTCEIAFAVVWQVVFFDSVPGPYSVAGIVLVMMAVLAVALHKCIVQRRENESAA